MQLLNILSKLAQSYYTQRILLPMVPVVIFLL